MTLEAEPRYLWHPSLLETFGVMPDDLERLTADELGRLREYVRDRNRESAATRARRGKRR